MKNSITALRRDSRAQVRFLVFCLTMMSTFLGSSAFAAARFAIVGAGGSISSAKYFAPSPTQEFRFGMQTGSHTFVGTYGWARWQDGNSESLEVKGFQDKFTFSYRWTAITDRTESFGIWLGGNIGVVKSTAKLTISREMSVNSSSGTNFFGGPALSVFGRTVLNAKDWYLLITADYQPTYVRGQGQDVDNQYAATIWLQKMI